MDRGCRVAVCGARSNRHSTKTTLKNLSFRYDVKATKTFCRDAAIAASWYIIVAAKATQWARFPHIHCLWGWRSVCPMRFSKPEVYVAWHHEQAMRRCSNLRPSEALGPVPTRALWGMLGTFPKQKAEVQFSKTYEDLNISKQVVTYLKGFWLLVIGISICPGPSWDRNYQKPSETQLSPNFFLLQCRLCCPASGRIL